MAVKLIIFDLDGTLLNTLRDLHGAVNVSLSDFSLPLRTMDEVRSFVGDGIPKLIQRSVPEDCPDDLRQKVLKRFLDHYKQHHSDLTRPYDGVIPLLQELKKRGFLTAVVSNKADPMVRALCEKFFPDLFDSVIGAKEGYPPKPAPDLVRLVLEELDTEPANALYIGDSEVDIATAANAGLDCLLVDWGFRSASYLVQMGAERIVSSPAEILLYLS